MRERDLLYIFTSERLLLQVFAWSFEDSEREEEILIAKEKEASLKRKRAAKTLRSRHFLRQKVATCVKSI